MGIFRHRNYGRHSAEDDADDVWSDPQVEEGDDYEPAGTADGPLGGRFEGPLGGPFDVEDAPDDQRPRLDLGSIRVPVPDGAQLQVEMTSDGAGVRAVHLQTSGGQITINAYAAPRSGGLWDEICGELAEQLRKDGARVGWSEGDWGAELAGQINDVALRFVGVDGPRWMLRGVVAGAHGVARQSEKLLRDIVRGTVVVRGSDPMPVRTPLPLTLPEEIAAQVERARAQAQQR